MVGYSYIKDLKDFLMVFGDPENLKDFVVVVVSLLLVACLRLFVVECVAVPACSAVVLPSLSHARQWL